jgi:hypothetical protein
MTRADGVSLTRAGHVRRLHDLPWPMPFAPREGDDRRLLPLFIVFDLF